MNTTISVIVPVYNTEKYLARCLDSLLNQTYRDLEIIVIDDGSKDGSPAICDAYAQKDGRIRVIHKTNAGVSAARNDGLAVVSGEYVTFMDSDDYIDKTMYETLHRLITQTADVDIAVCGTKRELSNGAFTSYYEGQEELVFSQREAIVNLLSNTYYCCSVCDKLIRRETVSDIRFDVAKKHNEDLLFLYEVMKRANRVAFSPAPLYYYCLNASSATHAAFGIDQMAILDVSEYIYDDVKRHYPDLIGMERQQYVRNYLTTAMQMTRSGYCDPMSIRRIRANVKKELRFYLFSKASLGYKLGALCLSCGWKVFQWYSRIIDK